MNGQVVFPIITREVEQLPFFVTGIGQDFEESGVVREKGYKDYQWGYCLEGTGIFKIKGQSYKITKGMAFFFRKDIPHQYQAVTKPWRTDWMTFNGGQIEGLLGYMGMGDTEVIGIEREIEVRQRLKAIACLLSGGAHLRERTLKASGELYEFLIFMRENKAKNQNQGKDKHYERLSPVINYMDTHYQQTITLEQLAEQIDVTKYYLCRLFKETYESKPFDYLNQIRIQKAKAYLVTQEQIKIKEVGQLVGFNDTSYFCLKFKEYEGCSPLEFKRRYNV